MKTYNSERVYHIITKYNTSFKGQTDRQTDRQTDITIHLQLNELTARKESGTEEI